MAIRTGALCATGSLLLAARAIAGQILFTTENDSVWNHLD
jgi:hypothetical protein